MLNNVQSQADDELLGVVVAVAGVIISNSHLHFICIKCVVCRVKEEESGLGRRHQPSDSSTVFVLEFLFRRRRRLLPRPFLRLLRVITFKSNFNKGQFKSRRTSECSALFLPHTASPRLLSRGGGTSGGGSLISVVLIFNSERAEF